MKRFYSHYSFIYPDTYLKNHIVEMDDNRNIIKVFRYEKEVEKTEFYSGLLVFLPDSVELSVEFFNLDHNNFSSDKDVSDFTIQAYQVYHEEIGKILF